MKKIFLKIRFILVTRYLVGLYRKERADMFLYMENNPIFPVSNKNSVDETIAYCQTLSLKKVKMIRKESDVYWVNQESIRYAERATEIRFSLPKGFDPVFALSISRKLDDPNFLGIHSIVTDKGNYIPVATEQLAAAMVQAAAELLEEKNKIEQISNGH
jgi:hypothetical protein